MIGIEMSEPPKPIAFRYNSQRATQAILWLLHKHGGGMDKLKLVKLLFYADREHLVRYGRPIIGGDYVAMQHGPVPSQLLNYLNRAAEEADLPFNLQDHHVLAKEVVNEDELSESDIEVLEYINTEYGKYDPITLRNLTHELKAYQSCYPDPTVNTSRPLPYEAFFLDLKDDGILDIVRDNQEAWAELGW